MMQQNAVLCSPLDDGLELEQRMRHSIGGGKGVTHRKRDRHETQVSIGTKIDSEMPIFRGKHLCK